MNCQRQSGENRTIYKQQKNSHSDYCHTISSKYLNVHESMASDLKIKLRITVCAESREQSGMYIYSCEENLNEKSESIHTSVLKSFK